MTVHTTSKYITIPSSVRSIRVLLKGEGGAASIAYGWNCFISCNSADNATLNGGTTMSFKGSGSDTRFLGLTAGGGRGGRGHDVSVSYNSSYITGTYKNPYSYQQIPYTGSPTPGQADRGAVPQSLILRSENGNSASTSNAAYPSRIGGVGPGGDGSSGNTGTRQVPGSQVLSICGVAPGNESYCTTLCPYTSGYCGWPCGTVSHGGAGCNCPGSTCCRCGKRISSNMNGQGGTSGALIEAKLDRNYLISSGILNTSQHWLDVNSATRQDGTTSNLATRLNLYNNPGPEPESIHSNLNNGSAEIIFEFAEVYVKTSQGWMFVNKMYIKQKEIVNNLTVENWKEVVPEPEFF